VRSLAALACLGFLTAAGAGCASGPPPVALRPSGKPPLDCVVRFVVPAPAGERARGELRLDPVSLERAIHEAFEPSRACTGVTFAVKGEESSADGADLELELESPTPPTYAFSRRTGWFIPNTLLWFFGGFPSFWVADRAYEVQWDARLRFRSASTGRELKAVDLPLREESVLSIIDRGWTLPVLYTPPGLYEGPQTSTALESRLEAWLVGALLERLDADGRGLVGEVEIDIDSPGNLATASEPIVLRARVQSPAVLERLRVELDRVPVYERDALTMIKAARSADGSRYEYDLSVPLNAPPGEHLLRIHALRRGESAAGPDGRTAAWSATRSVRFRVVGGD